MDSDVAGDPKRYEARLLNIIHGVNAADPAVKNAGFSLFIAS